MYTQFFGLNEKPFAITPDPRYLFMSERHGEGLAHLLYGVTDSGGFIQLTGEVGTGKTMLVRTLLGQLPKEVDVALILNPQVSVNEFLRAICRELGVTLPTEIDSSMALVDALNRFLLDAHARGQRIILLVDEAQNLSKEVLEQLRLLTNLETAKQKLLQIILIGQPELREILARNDLRQLAQRVTGRYHLEPLSREEAANYIDHRMKVAGGLGEIFTEAAKTETYRVSGGIPRIMNVVCDRALLGAYSQEVRRVDKELIQKAAEEVSGKRVQKHSSARWAGIAAAAALLAIAAVYLPRLLDSPRSGSAMAGARSGPAQLATAARTLEGSGANPAIATAPEMPGGDTEAETSLAGGTRGSDRPSLGTQLATSELAASGDDAMRRLLSLWGVDFTRGDGNGCELARQSGLSCLWQKGSFGVLRQLDRPAILTLTDQRGDAYQGVLISFAGDEVELAFGEQTNRYTVQEISDVWLGQYMIVWQPPNGTPRSIRRGMRSPEVAWLRQSLTTIGGDTENSDSDFFDADLEAKVRAFQRQNRLQVDGVAGEQTQIIINSQLADDGTPRLSGDI